MAEHAEKQATFDFSRGDQLYLLDTVPIASRNVTEGKGSRVRRVSGASIRATLRAIDSFCRGDRAGFPSEEKIGKVIGRCGRTVRFAIAALEDMQFLLVDKRDGRSSVFRVNWGEISLRCGTASLRSSRPGDPVKPDTGRAASSPTSTTSNQDVNQDVFRGSKQAALRPRTPEPSPRTPEPSPRTPEPGSYEASEAFSKRIRSGRPDHKCSHSIRTVEIDPQASRLFDAIGYRGNDGHTIWLAAAAVHLGLLTEECVAKAARLTREKSKGPGYFRVVLSEKSGLGGDALSDLFRSIRVLPTLPKSAPTKTAPVVATAIHRPPPRAHTDADTNAARNAFLAGLEAIARNERP